MSYRFVNVKRTVRAQRWPGGEARQCSRCKVERRQTRPVTVTGTMIYAGATTKMPFAYCDEHDITTSQEDGLPMCPECESLIANGESHEEGCPA